MRDADAHAPRDGGVLVGAYIDPALKRTIGLLAARHDRSVSAEIRVALRRHVTTERLIAERFFTTTGRH